MKRFKFRLETLHHLREQRREAAERQLAQAAAAVLAATAALEEIQRQRDALETKLTQTTGVVQAAELAMQLDYIQLLDQRETEARAQLAAREREREACRAAALHAARDAEVTEQLRVRQQARHNAEVARAEQELLDELAVSAHWRGAQREEG
jgi:flagellar export protein FliJ